MCKLINKCDVCIADRSPIGKLNPFQIHLTFKPDNVMMLNEDCERLFLKLHIIQSGDKIEYISSSVHYSEDVPMEELRLLETALKHHNIIRSKIEVPFKKGIDGKYHETHWSFDNSFSREELLSQIGLKKSSNVMNGKYYYTYRSHDSSYLHSMFVNEVNYKVNNIFEKIRSETCIYDTNEELDQDWMK